MSYRQIVTSLSFFQIMANLEQSGSRILDAQHVKFIFSLVETFFLSKTENRTKKSLTQPSHYCFEQNADFFAKIADVSKVKRALLLKYIFSETIYVCVLMYQISSF